MGQGKQAKVLTETQIKAVLAAVDGRRYPKRDRVMLEPLAQRQHAWRMNGGKAKRICGKLYAPKWPWAERDQMPSSIGGP
jgi:hypothetical protein